MEINKNIRSFEETLEHKAASERQKEHVMHGKLHKHEPPTLPPHKRKGMLAVSFDDNDLNVFREAFGGDDEAAAALGIVKGAPPEIQILVAQLLDQIEFILAGPAETECNGTATANKELAEIEKEA